jgi:hypothetical protein
LHYEFTNRNSSRNEGEILEKNNDALIMIQKIMLVILVLKASSKKKGLVHVSHINVNILIPIPKRKR